MKTAKDYEGVGKTRVSILGAGCGGMSVAFWLTSTEDLRSQYEVTVYTRGWRVGGKGASGRNSKVNSRIEEHGLHLWMGCYQTAFAMIRKCYDEWQAMSGGPPRSWLNAFAPLRRIVLQEIDGPPEAPWLPWPLSFPRMPGEPGDPAVPPFSDLVVEFSNRLQDFLAKNIPNSVGLGDFAAALAKLREAARSPTHSSEAALSLEQLNATLFSYMDNAEVAYVGSTNDLRRSLILANLGLAMALGLARDILPYPEDDYAPAFNRLNGQDFREWLAGCLAQKRSLLAAPVRALYDLTFAYKDGDVSRPSIAAGVTMWLVLDMMVGYRDAPFWKMNGGMGDVIFAPLYEVLRARGVQFEFFHRVREILPSPDGSSVGSVRIDRQATLIVDEYSPLISIKETLKCWPNEPLWEQLKSGNELAQRHINFESAWDFTSVGQVELRSGRDFDIIVVAVPPDVIREVSPHLMDSSRKWKAMVDNSTSVCTQAFQLWLELPLEKLGWPLGPTAVTAFAEPFDSWADMSHLLPFEEWHGRAAPNSIAYFCGVLPRLPDGSSDPIEEATRAVTANAETWLQEVISAVWPNAALPRGPIKPGIIISSYFRANIDPSERYVQVPAGSVDYRLEPGSSSFTNLFLAGDWTRTRYSGGCVETAVEAGLLAAEAISGRSLFQR